MTNRQEYLTQGLIVWLGILSVSFYNFQPFLVGGFVTLLQISEVDAGLVATSNMLGVCIGLAMATFKIHKWNIRHLVLFALLLTGVGNLLSAFTHSFDGLVAVRFFTGLGEGLALAAAISTTAIFAKPDRIFALVMIGMSLYGMLGLLVLPSVIDAFGLKGVFSAIALLSFVSLPLCRLFPNHDADDKGQLVNQKIQLGRPVILVLLSLMVVYISTNGVWTYYERIGVAIGVSYTDIGLALSLGLFASMIGALLAAVLSDRYGRVIPVTFGLILALVSIIILHFSSNFMPYTLSVMLLFGTTGFVVPYYMGTLAEADHTGRLPVVGYLIVFVGNFIGPAMAAGMVKPDSYSMLMFVAAALFLVALMLIIAAFRCTTYNSIADKPRS